MIHFWICFNYIKILCCLCSLLVLRFNHEELCRQNKDSGTLSEELFMSLIERLSREIKQEPSCLPPPPLNWNWDHLGPTSVWVYFKINYLPNFLLTFRKYYCNKSTFPKNILWPIGTLLISMFLGKHRMCQMCGRKFHNSETYKNLIRID